MENSARYSETAGNSRQHLTTRPLRFGYVLAARSIEVRGSNEAVPEKHRVSTVTGNWGNFEETGGSACLCQSRIERGFVGRI